jgi:preprotein translocase subunit SecD
MGRDLLLKHGIIAVVVIASLVLAMPPRDKIHLGLDLQGGLHLLLEVQVDKAIERTLERRAEALRKELVAKGLTVVAVEPSGLQGIRMVFSKLPEKSVVEEVVRNQDPSGEVRQQSAEVWMYNVQAAELQHFRTSAVDQALEKIRNRVDAFGVSEPSISREGTQRIAIQLPGLTDTKRAVDLIGKTAQLELKLVHSQASSPTATPPPGTQLLFMKKKDPRTGQLVDAGAYYVERRAAVSGDMLADARAVPDQSSGQYYVLMRLDSRGKKIFERVTRESVGKAMAIVLDDTIFSAPVIQEPIPGGEARITGSFTPEEARDLAIVLREGALPAPVTVVENRAVGPSLGSDSIAQGVRAALLGSTLVVVFMLVYYRFSGLIATLALALNFVIIMGVLALPGLGATLTLPGIAGIILTLGMAVDANVLIFERVREELRTGKSARAAVDAGFDRAFSAILDANATTIVAAIVLFQFGTGPVKGFAVTLTIGIAVSMFTAIFVSRVVFETIFRLRRVTSLSI